MQGLFQLGIVGSREEMLDFIEKSKENEMLKDWVIDEEEVETDGGLRSVEGSGLKKILDKYKLIVENGGSGNINGIEEMAEEVSKISPELEVTLLTQYLDTCSNNDWFIYYYPSGKTRDVAESALISKGEAGMSWWDIQDFMSYDLASYVNIDKVWEYYKKNESYFENTFITKEILEYYIAENGGTADGNVPDDYDEKKDNCDDILTKFFDKKAENIEYSYEPDPDNVNLPSLAYVSRLFGEKFVEHYRFTPETFDNRFEGKVFAVTGEANGYGKEKLKMLISKFGGVVRSRLSGKTNYLIVGDYADNSKIAKAKELGTQIIDVDEFEKMISE